MKRLLAIIIAIYISIGVAYANEDIDRLIEIAKNELNYTENSDGTTKYGIWSGDPTAQWCAEFICWCVNQVDEKYGTQLLNKKYPLYSSRNVGRDWYIHQGRYVDRRGKVPEWGEQWYWADGKPIIKNGYVPRMGDLIFLGYEGNFNTSHVALVIASEHKNSGCIVKVIEGNNPDCVQYNEYDIAKEQILGYGTYYNDIGTTMKFGNQGFVVENMQKQLCAIELLQENNITGIFDKHTYNAIIKIQERIHHTPNGIADYITQKAIMQAYNRVLKYNSYDWIVED